MIDKTIDEVYTSLANIVNLTYSKVLHKVLLKTNDSIIVFNKYAIMPTISGVKIASRMSFTELEFSNSKTALVWAILDHHGKFIDSARVSELDDKISGVTVELEIHKRLRITANFEKYSILSNKIHLNLERKSKYTSEMSRYVNAANKLMSSDFEKT